MGVRQVKLGSFAEMRNDSSKKYKIRMGELLCIPLIIQKGSLWMSAEVVTKTMAGHTQTDSLVISLRSTNSYCPYTKH